jgi:hypothetical protein
MNTSYNDLKKITPLERGYILDFIKRDLERENELREKLRNQPNT